MIDQDARGVPRNGRVTITDNLAGISYLYLCLAFRDLNRHETTQIVSSVRRSA